MGITDILQRKKLRFYVRQTLKGTAASMKASLTFLWRFWKQEAGQDLIEYTLLIAFVALASSALFLGANKSIKGVWSNSSTQIDAANSNLGGS